MQIKQLSKSFKFIPFVFLASIIMGPTFNYMIMLYKPLPISDWSFDLGVRKLSDIMAIAFILFAFILLITFRYIDKIPTEPAFVFCIIFIGFNCIYLGLATTKEFYYLFYILMGAGIGFSIPIIINIINNLTDIQQREINHLLAFLIGVILWTAIIYLTFDLWDLVSWRKLYMISGIINILSSPLIISIKIP